MASLTLLVCFLLVSSTYSQPDWLSAFNLGNYGNSRPNGYDVDTNSGGGYAVPRPAGNTGGNTGGSSNTGGAVYVVPRPAGNPSTGGSPGYVVPRPAGNPSTGGNPGYVVPRPAGNPSTGGNPGYVVPLQPGYPAGNPSNPSTGGNGVYVPARPSPGYVPGSPSTGTGVSDCKCKPPVLECTDFKANGNTAKCPAGYTGVSCGCANGCSSTTFTSSDTCRCDCYDPDWALIRCCRNV